MPPSRSQEGDSLMRIRSLAVAAVFGAVASTSVPAAAVTVEAGASIQAALDAAAPGDTIAVMAGTFAEDLDFRGKAVAVVGRGPASVLLGTGTGPVVRFTSNEGADSVLDSFTITGGAASVGGGILIENASPTVVRNVVTGNFASGQGSGIAVRGTGGTPPSPLIANNLLSYNTNLDGIGDPHTIQVVNATPVIVNNTIVEGDSNGILLSGSVSAATVIMNNVIALNGTARQKRGRGICDFSGGAVIQWNVFYRNTVAALLTRTGRNYRRVRAAEREIGDPNLAFNSDRSPRFEDARRGDFRLRTTSPARNGGNPNTGFANRDGSRNTVGHTGGPLADPLVGRCRR
jgi:hypothetical protein